MNEGFQPLKYSDAVLGSLAVAKEICSVVLFLVVFWECEAQRLSEGTLIVMSVALLICGLVVRHVVDASFGLRELLWTLRNLSILLAALLALAPLLPSLMAAVSRDTILASSHLLLLLHLLTHDYVGPPGAGIVVPARHRFASPVSLNAAVLSAVMLSSRLPSPVAAFGLVFFAIETFALFPLLRYHIRASRASQQHQHQPVLVLLMAALLVPLLWRSSPPAALLFAALLLTVSLLVPLLYVRMQHRKRVISGPWDEAAPDPPNPDGSEDD